MSMTSMLTRPHARAGCTNTIDHGQDALLRDKWPVKTHTSAKRKFPHDFQPSVDFPCNAANSDCRLLFRVPDDGDPPGNADGDVAGQRDLLAVFDSHDITRRDNMAGQKSAQVREVRRAPDGHRRNCAGTDL